MKKHPCKALKIYYSNLNLEKVFEPDYNHVEKVRNFFNTEKLGEYNEIYVHIGNLLLTDVFEYFCEMCNKTYELDLFHLFIRHLIKKDTNSVERHWYVTLIY